MLFHCQSHPPEMRKPLIKQVSNWLDKSVWAHRNIKYCHFFDVVVGYVRFVACRELTGGGLSPPFSLFSMSSLLLLASLLLSGWSARSLCACTAREPGSFA